MMIAAEIRRLWRDEGLDMAKEAMWIEVSRASPSWSGSNSARQGTDSLDDHQALMAARVIPKPFSLVHRWRWGFTNQSLLEEALDRQRLFIEAQHTGDDLAVQPPGDLFTLALRCFNDPQTAELNLVLVAKVKAADAARAQTAANDYWEVLKATFPYEYELHPASSQEEFEEISGQRILNRIVEANPPRLNALTQIRRSELVLNVGSAAVFLVGKWQPSNFSNEQIWRALGGSSRPVMLSVLLRPTVLYDDELFTLGEAAQFIDQAATSPLPMVTQNTGWARDIYRERLRGLRYPYQVQVHLLSPNGIPEALARAVGSALAHNTPGNPPLPGYQLIQARNAERLRKNALAMASLEPTELADDLADIRFARLRDLMDYSEAQAAFHWPVPPETGIPGVEFKKGNPVESASGK
jgi:hypothetical protein